MNPALDVATTTPSVRPTHKLRCTEPMFDAGGGGINVARVLKELGCPATAVFPAGGPAGAMLGELLAAANVPFSAVPIGARTRESFAVTDQTSGEQYRFVLPGPSLTAADEHAVLDRLTDLSPAPAYLVLSGSMTPGLGEDFFDRLRAHVLDRGMRIVLDSSGAGLRLALGLGAYLVKPSQSELEAMAGGPLADDAAIIAASRSLIGRGLAEIVLVSLGARGAMLITAQSQETIASIDVPIVSGVGAGDSMVAAVTLALARGWPLGNAVRYGVAAGAAALCTPATRLVHSADVERLYADILARDGLRADGAD